MAQYTHPDLRLESSGCTKCSLFDQQSLLITKLAGLGLRNFNSRATKKAKSLILPSVGRKENRWATPNSTAAAVRQESLEV